MKPGAPGAGGRNCCLAPPSSPCSFSLPELFPERGLAPGKQKQGRETTTSPRLLGPSEKEGAPALCTPWAQGGAGPLKTEHLSSPRAAVPASLPLPFHLFCKRLSSVGRVPSHARVRFLRKQWSAPLGRRRSWDGRDTVSTERLPQAGGRGRGWARPGQVGSGPLSTCGFPFWVHTRVPSGAWELLPSAFPRGVQARPGWGPLL